jgi:hypothetical protein
VTAAYYNDVILGHWLKSNQFSGCGPAILVAARSGYHRNFTIFGGLSKIPGSRL